jgi:predicted permease
MRLRGQRVPTNLDFTPDGTVLAYAMAIAVFAALAFGLAPAFRGTRVSVSETLKGQNARVSGRFPLQGALIAVQVAVSVALLMTAGLLLRGLDRAGSLDLGFRTDGVTALRVQLPPNAYDAAAERRFFDDLLPLLQAGNARVGMSSLLPLGDARNFTDFVVPDATPDVSQAMPVQDATPGYFEVLGIPVLVGRTFGPGDRDLGAIMVNQSLARLYWPDRSPIGQSVTIGNRPREVVGVVRDAQLNGIGSRGPMYFTPFAANSQGVGEPPVILLPSPMASSAAAAVRAADATAFTEAIPLSEQAHRSLGDARGSARLAGVLAWLALLLATSGVYGVISYSVEQRRREIMIRVALGARPRGVVGLVLRSNATPIGLGIVVGILISAGGSVLLNSQLYGLSPLDPAALAGVATVLLVAGAAASTIPARRAVRMDPVAALHQE